MKIGGDETVNIRGDATSPPTSINKAVKTRRKAYFAEAAGFVDTPVYDRYALPPGFEFEGPAIVEERESTAVLGPGARCRVDERSTIIVEMPA